MAAARARNLPSNNVASNRIAFVAPFAVQSRVVAGPPRGFRKGVLCLPMKAKSGGKDDTNFGESGALKELAKEETPRLAAALHTIRARSRNLPFVEKVTNALKFQSRLRYDVAGKVSDKVRDKGLALA